MQWSQFYKNMCTHKNFPGGTVDKNQPANAGDKGLITIPGRFHIAVNNWVPVPQLPSQCFRALQPQLRKPTCLEPVLCLEKPPQWEAWRVAPTHRQLEKAPTEQCCQHIYISPWKSGEGVPWLGLCASTARGTGLIPGWGSKILHAVPCGKK